MNIQSCSKYLIDTWKEIFHIPNWWKHIYHEYRCKVDNISVFLSKAFFFLSKVWGLSFAPSTFFSPMLRHSSSVRKYEKGSRVTGYRTRVPTQDELYEPHWSKKKMLFFQCSYWSWKTSVWFLWDYNRHQ